MSHRNGSSQPVPKNVIQACVNSECFKAEVEYARRGGYEVETLPRLYKYLYNDLIRVVFPTTENELEDGSVLAITCLFDPAEDVNIYAHAICAGPGVNSLLRAIHSPLGSSLPQEGVVGEKEVLRFVEWKKAAWGRFLIEELDLGSEKASRTFINGFWTALDRMFGWGFLINTPVDQVGVPAEAVAASRNASSCNVEFIRPHSL